LAFGNHQQRGSRFAGVHTVPRCDQSLPILKVVFVSGRDSRHGIDDVKHHLFGRKS
jgi:hypothetical protein